MGVICYDDMPLVDVRDQQPQIDLYKVKVRVRVRFSVRVWVRVRVHSFSTSIG